MSRMTSVRAGFGCRTNQRPKTAATTTRSTTTSADTSGVYCNAAQMAPVDAIFEIRMRLPAFGHEKSPRERAWWMGGLGLWLAASGQRCAYGGRIVRPPCVNRSRALSPLAEAGGAHVEGSALAAAATARH